MKRFLLIFTFFLSISIFAQVPAYYNGVDFSKTGLALKPELTNKITSTHVIKLQYNDVWTAIKQTDLDPANSNNVLLIYGYNDGDGNPITDRTRNKNNNSGNNGDWNREHTYPQSLATPAMNTNIPNAGTDAHHIRSSDVQMNGNRGNRKFALGSGNAGNVGSNWYPGDEWKGDVARMMMYMYLRYPTQCLPNNVGVGASVGSDDMIDLFLQWNIEDTVSQYEKNRNTTLQSIQGNRNPFIDNPILATIIWGGNDAQDFWGPISVDENKLETSFKVYPVPSNNGVVNVLFSKTKTIDNLKIYSTSGKLLRDEANPLLTNSEYKIKNLPKGIFILQVKTNQTITTKKIVVN